MIGLKRFPIWGWQKVQRDNISIVIGQGQQESGISHKIRRGWGLSSSSSSSSRGISKRGYLAPTNSTREEIQEARESIFQQIVKLNEEECRGQRSMRFTKYNRLPVNNSMGKKGNKLMEESKKYGSRKLPISKLRDIIPYDPKNMKTNVKDNDLPIPMKYRNFRKIDKKVEVQPSRIHKNGLFAIKE